MEPVIAEYRENFPDIQLYARGDSGFSKTVNANRLQLHALVYNIFNWFWRLALPKNMNKHLIDSVWLKLFKVAAKVVHTGRYIKFKLCSRCPYKAEVNETFENIWQLAVQLE